MFALWFVATLALASAAPHRDFFHHHHGHNGLSFPPPPPPPPPRPGYGDSSEFFGEGVFDTTRFWQELETEMQMFNQMLSEFYMHFPTSSSRSGVKDNKYIVTISLNGFEEKDIKVKAKEGVLMVQATHTSEDGSERSYLDLKTLPSFVNVNGSWTFEMGVLKVVFPLNSQPDDRVPMTEADGSEATEAEVTEGIVTEAPTAQPDVDTSHSREEMGGTDENVNQDADVGLERGDRDKENEILNNFVPQDTNSIVEATTYAVDLKNEVEFVPVRY